MSIHLQINSKGDVKVDYKLICTFRYDDYSDKNWMPFQLLAEKEKKIIRKKARRAATEYITKNKTQLKKSYPGHKLIYKFADKGCIVIAIPK